MRFPSPRPGWLAFAALAACLLLALPGIASAQQQESGLLDRINNPDRTLAFPLSDKAFGKTAAYKNKAAAVRSFTMSKGASVRAGDGAFRAKTFGGDGAFKTKDFDVRDGAVTQKTFGQNNKLFDTAGYDVHAARDANKEMSTRGFDLHGPFSIQGKRQDTYDELLKRKKLSIEEVRELLNKNQ